MKLFSTQHSPACAATLTDIRVCTNSTAVFSNLIASIRA